MALTVLLLCASENSFANTQYTLMDADSNRAVDPQEFFAANPNMSEMAFQLIDTDLNSEISLEEWEAFVENHSSAEGFMQGSSSTTLPAQDGVIPPSEPIVPDVVPMGTGSSALQEPNVPLAPNTSSVTNLPLLSAPTVQNPSSAANPQESTVGTPNIPQVPAPTVDSPSVPQVELAPSRGSSLPLLMPNE